MDSVHGYIKIPRLFVKYIIDTPEFQRLRNIDQTGMKILYPSAKHDRFSHSLGVFHLGNIAVDALLDNFKENDHWKIRSNNSRYVFWAKNKVLFLIACLLHDIGHAPFSHSFERFYDFNTIIITADNPIPNHAGHTIFKTTSFIDNLAEQLSLETNNKESEGELTMLYKAAPHEKMSAYLLLSKDMPWRERIQGVLDSLCKESFPEPIDYVAGEYDKPFPSIDSSELEEDLQFIARMIMGVKYSDYHPESQIRNCFIELLNGSIDVDKLDYIVRDTKMSGINNISLDIERLLGSLTIIPTTIYKDSIIESDTPYTNTIIRELETDESAYLYINGVIDRDIIISSGEVSVPPENTISLQRKESNSTKYLSYNPVAFTNDSTVLFDGRNAALSQHDDCYTVSESDGTVNLSLKNAKVCCTRKTTNFNFSVSQGEYLLCINESADNPVVLKAHAFLYNTRFSGTIQGKVKFLEILSDQLKKLDIPPTAQRYTGYSLGFNKQAVNLISNVSDARNYLYLWIYSHHKVVYYANYLIIELARLALGSGSAGSYELGKYLTETIINPYKSFLLDDAGIHHYLRMASENKYLNNTGYEKLFNELTRRQYRNSLYKSLAEYDLVFEKYDAAQKMEIRKRLEKMSIPQRNQHPSAKISEADEKALEQEHETALQNVQLLKYGYITPDVLMEMKCGEESLSNLIEDMVWIESKPSIKKPDPSQIVISFKEEDMIVSMDRLPILSSENLNVEQNHYFYLYYRAKEAKVENYGNKKIKDMVKNGFLHYIDKNLFGSREN